MTKPNIVFILTDDHGQQAISAYGSKVNTTPNIDDLAAGGIRVDNCLCTNSLCAPSRAAILTGTYSHVNGVRTLATPFTADQPTFITELRKAGYRTALFGKWHLGHGGVCDPQGFDDWQVLIDQGEYFDPHFLTSAGQIQRRGYATDIITDLALDWIQDQGPGPWCVLIWHKAPHRPWEPDDPHAQMYSDPIPIPPTFHDTFEGRGTPAHHATMSIANDLTITDLKQPVPDHLNYRSRAEWKYQRYLEDYLRCIASVDDNVGRVTSYLREHAAFDDTVVIYSSDQGYYLGEHGWFDKRFMYEESLHMPLIVSYPAAIPPGSSTQALIENVDFAPTLLAAAGLGPHERMQGHSAWGLLTGTDPAPVREASYYRYFEHDCHMHHVWAHYGIRTDRYKLIYYYADGMGLPNAGPDAYPPEWEMFDLLRDPAELTSVHLDPAYAVRRAELTRQLWHLQRELGDTPHPSQPVPEGCVR